MKKQIYLPILCSVLNVLSMGNGTPLVDDNLYNEMKQFVDQNIDPFKQVVPPFRTFDASLVVRDESLINKKNLQGCPICNRYLKPTGFAAHMKMHIKNG